MFAYAVREHLNNLCFSSSIIQYLVTIVVHVAHDGVCFSVCQSSHGVCKHEGWIGAIRKICKTLTGACIHVPYLTCKSKATKKKKNILKITKNHKTLKGFHPPAPPTLTHEKCTQPQPHSDTNCAHYAVFLTHTLQSHCTACQAAFLFVQSCL